MPKMAKDVVVGETVQLFRNGVNDKDAVVIDPIDNQPSGPTVPADEQCNRLPPSKQITSGPLPVTHGASKMKKAKLNLLTVSRFSR